MTDNSQNITIVQGVDASQLMVSDHMTPDHMQLSMMEAESQRMASYEQQGQIFDVQPPSEIFERIGQAANDPDAWSSQREWPDTKEVRALIQIVASEDGPVYKGNRMGSKNQSRVGDIIIDNLALVVEN